MSATPRRRSLLGRAGNARRSSDRRSVTAPLRIGKDVKLTIEELEALAIEDFDDDDDFADEDEDDLDDSDDAPFEDERDLGLELGEDTVRSDVEEEATGTVWTRARGVAEPSIPIGLPLGGAPLALDVIERGVSGEGYVAEDTHDSFVHDDVPAEEVRRDARFAGIDFTGAAQAAAVLPPLPSSEDTLRLAEAPAPPAPEPLRLYGMVAAVLGSGSVAVIAVCVVVGTLAVGALLLGGRGTPTTEIVPATVAPEVPPVVEPAPVQEPVAEVPRKRPKPAPVEVAPPPEPVAPAPAPVPVPEPAVVADDPPEDDKKGLFGKKKKR